MRPDHVWSYDFVAARTADGSPLRILNIVDKFTRELGACDVARSIGAREITRAFANRGRPAIIRSNTGREFIATTVVNWLAERDVAAAFIAKASPQQNCYVERFDGIMRDELLNAELFTTLLGARVVITRWAESYNDSHRHSTLGMMAPAAFAAACERG